MNVRCCLLFHSFFALFWSNFAGASTERLNLCATIRPLYSLIYSVAEGAADVTLLFSDSRISPHDYIFTPSNIKDLAGCDIIFMISHDLEFFMGKAIKSSAKKTSEVIELSQNPRIKLLPTRENNFDHELEQEYIEHTDHSSEQEHHHHHHHDGYDMHFWLDIDNATTMVEVIAQTLARVDARNAKIYAHNVNKLKSKLKYLDEFLAKKLKPYSNISYLVFHDAYQYFEKRYNLRSSGAITVNPGKTIGAKNLSKLNKLITGNNIKCLFAEPQFPSRLVNMVAKSAHINTGSLDAEWGPIGLNDPKEIYFKLMEDLADNLISCLEKP